MILGIATFIATFAQGGPANIDLSYIQHLLRGASDAAIIQELELRVEPAALRFILDNRRALSFMSVSQLSRIYDQLFGSPDTTLYEHCLDVQGGEKYCFLEGVTEGHTAIFTVKEQLDAVIKTRWDERVPLDGVVVLDQGRFAWLQARVDGGYNYEIDLSGTSISATAWGAGARDFTAGASTEALERELESLKGANSKGSDSRCVTAVIGAFIGGMGAGFAGGVSVGEKLGSAFPGVGRPAGMLIFGIAGAVGGAVAGACGAAVGVCDFPDAEPVHKENEGGGTTENGPGEGAHGSPDGEGSNEEGGSNDDELASGNSGSDGDGQEGKEGATGSGESDPEEPEATDPPPSDKQNNVYDPEATSEDPELIAAATQLINRIVRSVTSDRETLIDPTWGPTVSSSLKPMTLPGNTDSTPTEGSASPADTQLPSFFPGQPAPPPVDVRPITPPGGR